MQPVRCAKEYTCDVVNAATGRDPQTEPSGVAQTSRRSFAGNRAANTSEITSRLGNIAFFERILELVYENASDERKDISRAIDVVLDLKAKTS